MRFVVSEETDFRERVGTYLTLLASDGAHEALGRLVDPERLAFELCRVWFDHVYVAGHRYFDGLKGDFSHDAAARFRRAFTAEELAKLERFSRFLELRLEMLPDYAMKERRIPNNDAWQNLVRDAAYMLDDLAPQSDVRRRRLADWLAGVDASDSTEWRHLVETSIKRSEG